MIRINLLPKEFRRKEGTSFKVIGATALGALAVCGALGTFGYIWFGKLAEVEKVRAHLEEDYTTLEPQALYQERLKAEKQEFAQREQTIKEIRQKRVLWTAKLDQFIDAVNNNGDDERHLAWFDSLSIKPVTTGFDMALAGHCAGPDVARVANLLDDLTDHEFYQDFVRISEPSGSLETSQKNLEPKESIGFPLTMQLKPGASKPARGGK